MTVSMYDWEWLIRDEITAELGIDANGVMRQGMLDLGRKLGFTREWALAKLAAHPPKKKNGSKH